MKQSGIKNKKSGRIQREAETVAVMIHKYCRLKHGGANELCRDCTELLDYVTKK
ncbi:MAG: nitrous oxide-stimulated promoter family protein [Candidatus Electrothrix scaldis]|nr:MAG: nitrous oxide-stimulated promoter family protein [Candidatus Electrothrix sp. GW3-3]